MQAILALVAWGLGVALMPEAMRPVHMENVHYLAGAQAAGGGAIRAGAGYKPANPNPRLNALLAMVDRMTRG